MKRGIIQSRGLGDIIIALPIAKWYYDNGDEIIWPICEEFYSSVKDVASWVQWRPIPRDAQGRFFLEKPLEIFRQENVDINECLNLYQFLNSNPELTDVELFNILKFDQYKYWVSAVPFIKKWTLSECITRDLTKEKLLLDSLNIQPNTRYCVIHSTGSDFRAEIDLSWVEQDVTRIHVENHYTDSIFDWISVLENAEAFIGIDSAMANLVDSLQLPIPNLYWLRRSQWDLTPVLGSAWTIVPTTLPIVEATRVNPEKLAAAKRNGQGQAQTYIPYQMQGTMPKNFMHAVKH